jgi:hypothetical protein
MKKTGTLIVLLLSLSGYFEWNDACSKGASLYFCTFEVVFKAIESESPEVLDNFKYSRNVSRHYSLNFF